MGLKTALCQMDVVWGDKTANLTEAGRLMGRTDADLVVLPEMFTTGFDIDPAPLAEKMDGESVCWIRDTARKSGKAIVGSVIIEDGGKYFNRLLFAMPDGKLHHYDKRHLFSFSGENRNFSAGRERIIIEYKGFRILPLVCYDLRFPVWSRGSDEFDTIIYIASWPASRIRVWDTLLKARAIENQCYVLGVNRVGQDPSARYDGHSAAINYYGDIMVAGSHEDNSGQTATNSSGTGLLEGRLDSYLLKKCLHEGKIGNHLPGTALHDGEAGNHLPGTALHDGEAGNCLFEAENGIIEAELELEPLHTFRDKFPAWRDSDKFEIVR